MLVIKLKRSHTTTMGANVVPNLAVPKGCMEKRKTRAAHETPTIAGVPSSGLTTRMPWMAPRTDYAGVRTPSATIIETPCDNIH